MPEPRARVLRAGKFVQLMKKGHWEFAERTGAQGAVAVIAITAADELVLVEQERPPVGARVIELPAGLVGDVPGESAADWRTVARRELLEETGFLARRISRVAAGPSSAGLCSERMTLALARGVTRVHAGGGIDHESIQVHVVRRANAERWLSRQARRGRLIDLKIYAGLYFAGRLSLPPRRR